MPSSHRRRAIRASFAFTSIGLAAVLAVACSGPTRSALPPDASPDLRRVARDCDADVASACLAIGRAWYDGDGLPADPPRGIALIRTACSANVEGACEQLEITRLTGRPSSRAVARAQSCDLGDLGACAQLADLYREGRGLPESAADGSRIHEDTCAAGYAPSCAARYEMLWNAEGETRDTTSAVEYLHRACELGHQASCERSFEISFGDGATDEALGEARGCDRGDPAACVAFGDALQSGDGARMNLAGARRAFEQACDGGSGHGCVSAARMWRSIGTGDRERSDELYARACDDGLGEACTEFGAVTFDASSTHADFEEAHTLWQRGCDLGDEAGCAAAPGRWESGLGSNAHADARREAHHCDQAVGEACGALADRMVSAAGVARDLQAAVLLHTRGCLLGDQEACPDALFQWPCSVESLDATDTVVARDEFTMDDDGRIATYRRTDAATGQPVEERRYTVTDDAMILVQTRQRNEQGIAEFLVPPDWNPIPIPPAAFAWRGTVELPWWSFAEIDEIRSWNLPQWLRDNPGATVGQAGSSGSQFATAGNLTATFHQTGRMVTETDGGSAERRAQWASTGNLLRLSRSDATSSGGTDVRYNGGRLAEIQDTRVNSRDTSTTLIYEYSADGRLAGVVVSSNAIPRRGQLTWVVLFEYDRAGNPTTAEVTLDEEPAGGARYDYSCYANLSAR